MVWCIWIVKRELRNMGWTGVRLCARGSGVGMGVGKGIGVLGAGARIDLAHLNITFKPRAYLAPNLTIPPVTTAA